MQPVGMIHSVGAALIIYTYNQYNIYIYNTCINKYICNKNN